MSGGARKVLFVSHELACGGAELSLLDLLAALDRDRYEPELVVSGDGPLRDRASALDVPCHEVPMRFSGKVQKLLGIRSAARAIAEVARRSGADLMHANTLIAGYCALLARRRCGRPVVWHVRDMSYPWAAKLACARADRLIANSCATAGTLPARARDKAAVVHNGVASSFFADDPSTRLRVRAELGVDPGEFVVAVFGRITPWKGQLDLLAAVPQLLERHPHARFWLVGGALFGGEDHAAEVERAARSLGDRVTLLGDRNDVVDLLAAVDVVVQPSREPEPFGRSVAEAMAAGRAVVATRAGGLTEVVEDGVTGLLVAPADPAALGSAVSELCADPARRTAMGEAGRRRAELLFRSAIHARAVENVYADVLRDLAVPSR